MRDDIIGMSIRELNRLKIIQGVIGREVTQMKASEVLGLTERHVRRIVKRVREEGERGIVHKSRGRCSHRRMCEELGERIADVVGRKYKGFGPTLASEKLSECEGIEVSKEKLRQIMMQRGLWQRKRKRREMHPWRERKDHCGEMIQMDGSHHDWLEGRGPKLVLMGYVDDAMSRFYGRFYDYEGVYDQRWIHLSVTFVSTGFLRVFIRISTQPIRQRENLRSMNCSEERVLRLSL
jgi:hypothetical protein